MENEKIRSIQEKEPKNYGSLGREIKISPKANVSLSAPGRSVKFYVPTVDVLIGIGKDHVAYLIMDDEAWAALKAGEEIHITTTKEFKKNFL